MPMPAGWTVNHKDAERAGNGPSRQESGQTADNVADLHPLESLRGALGEIAAIDATVEDAPTYAEKYALALGRAKGIAEIALRYGWTAKSGGSK